MKKHVMYEGEIHEIDVPDGEVFEANNYIPGNELFEKHVVKETFVSGSTIVASRDQTLGKYKQDLLTDNNEFEPGSSAWFKFELDSFEGVDYKSDSTVEDLDSLLSSAHGLE